MGHIIRQPVKSMVPIPIVCHGHLIHPEMREFLSRSDIEIHGRWACSGDGTMASKWAHPDQRFHPLKAMGHKSMFSDETKTVLYPRFCREQ